MDINLPFSGIAIGVAVMLRVQARLKLFPNTDIKSKFGREYIQRVLVLY